LTRQTICRGNFAWLETGEISKRSGIVELRAIPGFSVIGVEDLRTMSIILAWQLREKGLADRIGGNILEAYGNFFDSRAPTLSAVAGPCGTAGE
jgi:hypothetical protein